MQGHVLGARLAGAAGSTWLSHERHWLAEGNRGHRLVQAVFRHCFEHYCTLSMYRCWKPFDEKLMLLVLKSDGVVSTGKVCWCQNCIGKVVKPSPSRYEVCILPCDHCSKQDISEEGCKSCSCPFFTLSTPINILISMAYG